MDCSSQSDCKNPSFSSLISAVEAWAAARDILQHSTATAQLMKTVSELGELADATMHDDKPGIIDGLGDVLVTLIIYARLQNISLPHCLQSAYETIKDRKGRLTASGVFLKEPAAVSPPIVPVGANTAKVIEEAVNSSRFIASDRFLEELAALESKQELATRDDMVITAKSGNQYRLVCTCPACPEQYDVQKMTGELIGYLRLRHGRFRADCPDVGGDTVYVSDTVKGDGAFEADERIPELTAAVNSIDLWWQDVKNKSRVSDVSAR